MHFKIMKTKKAAWCNSVKGLRESKKGAYNLRRAFEMFTCRYVKTNTSFCDASGLKSHRITSVYSKDTH